MTFIEACAQCGTRFLKKRKNHVFCGRKCVDKAHNDLRPRDTSKSYSLALKKKSMSIPSLQKEVMLGILMGDGSIPRAVDTRGFHRMSICHSKEQIAYIEWTRSILGAVFICSAPSGGPDQYSITSISHPEISSLYGLFYRNGTKTITRKVLNELTPTSLLFWFLDDGSRIKASGNSFVLCTDGFSLSENKAIKKWFWQRFGIEAFIQETHHRQGVGFCKEDKTFYRIRFRKDGSRKLFELMKSSPLFDGVPPSLLYKFETYI